MNKTMKTTVAGLLLAISAQASASLIENGSFEGNLLSDNSYKTFKSNKVNGWSGSKIEIWNNFNSVSAFEGDNFIELNSAGKKDFSIFQSFSTAANQNYDFDFAYAARTNNNEIFTVEILDDTNTVLFSQTIDDHLKNSWQVFEATFTATSDVSTIRFSADYASTGTLGNFIDGVQVASAQVPEPASVAIFGASVLLLGAARRRQK